MTSTESKKCSPIGLVVNPRSGTDVRRAIAAAGSVTVADKANIVRRVVLGACEIGANRFVVHGDPHRIVSRATETIRGLELDWIKEPLTFSEQDTTNAVRYMRNQGCSAVVVLGGDGTNRVAALEWPDIPVIPVSTGTNNAFPIFVEATVAGAAAGHLAIGEVSIEEVAQRSKVVRLEVKNEDGIQEEPDLALIDAVAVRDRYVGSLELFDPETLCLAVLTQADPSSVGFAGVGGLIEEITSADDNGFLIRFQSPTDSNRIIRGPTAPGHYADLGLLEARKIKMGEEVTVEGPVLLAFDGERKRRLVEGAQATIQVKRDGPWFIDVAKVMKWATRSGIYLSEKNTN
ncbi:MAG TPA: NAD(+)/NADH kinase [Acidimicrobiales bacterium]|nr:NAD(+)/NADH kinase [Acidimicrobiales bacterium]|tara:strand:- start:239 stop:1276 length:1038 start_codon:yes stop_codon:yes gene_type:complete